SQRQKSAEFQEQYRRRAAHEWKNGEMKRFHGMARAKGWGLRSVLFQAKFTAIAVNLKRIAALVEQLFFAFPCFSAKTGTFVPAMCFRGCVSAL
ncbi:MAG: transposase, partial [Oscillospiraceae bacterium]|nr:transposase [Oscillospiraceae bacterium]